MEIPSFRRMEVRPKAAGALWTRMAMNIIIPRLLLFEAGVVEEAPRAMPSARAWIRRPIVVGFGREGGGGVWCVEGADSGSIVERGMWWVCPFDEALEDDLIEGTMSIRYMSMKPEIREMPIHACGVDSS